MDLRSITDSSEHTGMTFFITDKHLARGLSSLDGKRYYITPSIHNFFTSITLYSPDSTYNGKEFNFVDMKSPSIHFTEIYGKHFFSYKSYIQLDENGNSTTSDNVDSRYQATHGKVKVTGSGRDYKLDINILFGGQVRVKGILEGKFFMDENLH